ncbi:MAG: hypothetical protein ABR981_04745 [Candidatus Micrarchaeaceae archaeon]|jgi:hypothetical protein
MDALTTQIRPTSQRGRERIRLKKLSNDYFEAEIPERWGKRVLNIKVYDRSYITQSGGYKEANFTIQYVKNDGTVSVPLDNIKEWKLMPNPNMSIEERIEEIVNNYYNSKWWILRALRT